MGYFTLFPNAKFSYDEVGGSIIDLLSFERIHYNCEEKDILLNVLDKNIEDLIGLDEKTQKLMLHIIENGYGYIYDNKVYNDMHRDKRDTEIRGLAEEPPHFSKIYLEITNQCNMNCSYCSDNTYVGYACNSCIKWKTEAHGNNNIFDYKKMLSRIGELWVDEIVISGGNPLLKKHILAEYIMLIRSKMPDVKISIYSNGCELDDELFNLFLDYEITLNIIVLGYDEESYKRITGKGDSFGKVIKNIKKCLKSNMDCCITLLGDQHTIEKAKSMLLEFDCPIFCVTDIFSSEYRLSEKNKFFERRQKVSSNYWENQKFNWCLNRKIAITSNGLVKPCPMIDDILLNLTDHLFDKLFQEMIIDKYWRFTKNDVVLCSKCPYKYSCEDCTLMEMAMNAGKIAPSLICDRFEK
ncbi:MAG: radical SAM protein [Lachnospiraceae bacterium]|nr:radical SAM protein [Lachnospiraceae bacterium]